MEFEIYYNDCLCGSVSGITESDAHTEAGDLACEALEMDSYDPALLKLVEVA